MIVEVKVSFIKQIITGRYINIMEINGQSEELCTQSHYLTATPHIYKKVTSRNYDHQFLFNCFHPFTDVNINYKLIIIQICAFKGQISCKPFYAYISTMWYLSDIISKF